MATSTIKRVREQTELEKVNKVVTGEEPELQIEDEQWEFRKLAQKEQQRLKEEQEKVKEQRAKLEAEEELRLQEQ